MTTSIDPSRDELFLLDDNQYQIPNVVLTNIKPIGVVFCVFVSLFSFNEIRLGREKTSEIITTEC